MDNRQLQSLVATPVVWLEPFFADCLTSRKSASSAAIPVELQFAVIQLAG
ncbi:MAG: hypothetical protein HW416_1740 [Chloroflexi bacterium]|nr:hypothetical protein [Chloroflexota bacterium]